jgi:hypothetical protein
MWNTIIIALLAASGLSVPGDFRLVARTLDDARVEGRLVALDVRRVTFDAAGGRRQWALDDLSSITRQGDSPSPAPLSIVVELVDGSTLAAQQVLVREGRVELARPFGPVVLRADDVRCVRLAPADPSLVKQWTRLVAGPVDSDMLVVAQGDSLNYHRGVLRDVAADRIEFESEGERLKVNRSKVFGLVYYHPSGRTLGRAVATLVDTLGSRWVASTIALDGDAFKGTTPAGVAIDCPMAHLARLDFSQGKILYLDELEPQSVRWTPYYALANELLSRAAYSAPVGASQPDGPALLLGGRRYSHGVAICSRTEVTYELPGECRRFRATVGIDDAVRPGGDARLVIRAEDRLLADLTLTGTLPPQAIDLDVAGAHRLTILVDFGRGGDCGDHVDFGNARIVK